MTRAIFLFFTFFLSYVAFASDVKEDVKDANKHARKTITNNDDRSLFQLRERLQNGPFSKEEEEQIISMIKSGSFQLFIQDAFFCILTNPEARENPQKLKLFNKVNPQEQSLQNYDPEAWSKTLLYLAVESANYEIVEVLTDMFQEGFDKQDLVTKPILESYLRLFYQGKTLEQWAEKLKKISKNEDEKSEFEQIKLMIGNFMRSFENR